LGGGGCVGIGGGEVDGSGGVDDAAPEDRVRREMPSLLGYMWMFIPLFGLRVFGKA
jgi:hypothetical protein